jgi:hypothetical protein
MSVFQKLSGVRNSSYRKDNFETIYRFYADQHAFSLTRIVAKVPRQAASPKENPDGDRSSRSVLLHELSGTFEIPNRSFLPHKNNIIWPNACTNLHPRAIAGYAGEITVSTDPYAAPKTHVADVPVAGPDGNFVPGGLTRPAGHGWDWIKSGRALTKQQTWTWIGIFVVFALIGGGLSGIPIVGPLALYFVMPILFGGVMLGCDAAHKGQPVTVGYLFAGFRSHLGKLAGIGLATTLLYLAIFLILAVIFGTGAALILSGMEQPDLSDPAAAIAMLLALLVMLSLSVPIYMAIWFSYALVTINDYGVVQALKASFFGCTKNVVPFLVYGVMMFLLAIVASIPLMLGWLILGPVMFASLYTGYRDIFYET